MHVRAYRVHKVLEGSHHARPYSLVCAFLLFPLSPKGQECVYPLETGGIKRETAARSEGSTPGIGSIARTRTCALARADVRARTTATRVCARDPLHRVRGYARSLDQGRSLFTPTGTDVIPIYRRLFRAPFHPPSLPRGIRTPPVFSLGNHARDASLTLPA